MRARWDDTVEKSRRAARAAGVAIGTIDKGEFRKAVQPLLDHYLRDPDIARLHDILRGFA